MRTHLTTWCLAACLLLTASWLSASRHSVVRAQASTGPLHFAIIMSKDVAQHEISRFLLKRVFSGEPTEYAGHRLIPFNYPPEHPLRQRFDALLLDLTPDSMSRYWIDRRIRGQGMPPRTVPAAPIMKAVVARLPGAIGYIPATMLDGSVTALTVDNQAAGSPGYPLISLRD